MLLAPFVVLGLGKSFPFSEPWFLPLKSRPDHTDLLRLAVRFFIGVCEMVWSRLVMVQCPAVLLFVVWLLERTSQRPAACTGGEILCFSLLCDTLSRRRAVLYGHCVLGERTRKGARQR